MSVCDLIGGIGDEKAGRCNPAKCDESPKEPMMREFFRGWPRIAGCVMLLCLLGATLIWLRIKIEIDERHGPTVSEGVHAACVLILPPTLFSAVLILWPLPKKPKKKGPQADESQSSPN